MIPSDKLSHIFAGISIVAFLLPFGLLLALSAVVFIAIAKELWDSKGNGTPETMDALATILGGAALIGWYHLV